jgi:transcription elongation factor Elf1
MCEKNIVTCWFCGGELVWQSDFCKTDYGYEEEGIVAELECSNCGAYATFVTKDEEGE